MAITKKEVKHIASLAKLDFAEEENEDFISKFDSVINYVEKLQAIDTTGIKPTSHPHAAMKNVMRKDKVEDSLDRKEIMKNAPEFENGYIKVDKVIE